MINFICSFIQNDAARAGHPVCDKPRDMHCKCKNFIRGQEQAQGCDVHFLYSGQGSPYWAPSLRQTPQHTLRVQRNSYAGRNKPKDSRRTRSAHREAALENYTIWMDRCNELVIVVKIMMLIIIIIITIIIITITIVTIPRFQPRDTSS
jgi:hypothetical protein